MIKLKDEQKIYLEDLFTHEGWPALAELMDELSKATITKLLSYNVDGNEDKIVYEKIRYEGMRQIINGVNAYRNHALKAKGVRNGSKSKSTT